MRILIVDDDFGALRAARRALRDEETLIATDVATALQLAERYHPDAILIDVLLGDENGLEAVSPLLKVSPDSAVAVTSASDSFKPYASASGAHAWIPKSAWTKLHPILCRILELLRGEQQHQHRL